MNNAGKVVFGTLLSVGIAAVAAKLTDQRVIHADEPRESFKERINRANTAASVARTAEEERLRNEFRARTGDPTAFVPGSITATPPRANTGAGSADGMRATGS